MMQYLIRGKFGSASSLEPKSGVPPSRSQLARLKQLPVYLIILSPLNAHPPNGFMSRKEWPSWPFRRSTKSMYLTGSIVSGRAGAMRSQSAPPAN